MPIIAVTVAHSGWRQGFGLCALLSFVCFVVFWRLYRDPDHRGEDQAPAAPVGLLAYLLRRRKVWGLAIRFVAYGYCFFLFLTWLPRYLVQTMHMSRLQSWGWTMIRWACATVGDLLFGGWLIDHLIAKGFDATRKSALIAGMCTGFAVFGATTTHDPVVAIVWISIALSGLAAAALVGWSLPSLIAPHGGTGTVASIMNFSNNAMGVAAPIITGYVVGRTQSFADAFLVAGAMLVVGVVADVVLLGRIEPLPEPQTRTRSIPP